MKARFVRARANRALLKSTARNTRRKGETAEKALSPSAATRKTRKVSVLQVEDNLPTQHLRGQVLTRAGYHVVNVVTVRDALASVAAARPDVVLCDVKLPDGSGFEVCRQMRVQYPGLPVILISAVYCADYDKESAVFGGASEYLVEPLAPTDLIAAIERQV